MYYVRRGTGFIPYVTTVAGAPIPMATPRVIRAVADYSINSTALTDFPGMTFPMASGETWVFDMVIRAVTVNAAADLRFNVIGDASGFYGVVNGENAVSKSPNIGVATTNIAVATGSAANADTYMIHGIATANSDTALQLQMRNNAGTTVQTFSGLSHIKGILSL